MPPAPTCDRGVIGHRKHGLLRVPDGARRGLIVTEMFDPTAEADGIGAASARELPGIAQGEPVLGNFLLPAVAEALLEQPVLVADAVAVGWNPERRHRIHEAGCQTAEPAIAERGIRLDAA